MLRGFSTSHLCPGLHVLAAGCTLSFHAPSQARHWLKIRTIMFWTLRCGDISWDICTRSLFCRTALLRELFAPVVEGTCPLSGKPSEWVICMGGAGRCLCVLSCCHPLSVGILEQDLCDVHSFALYFLCLRSCSPHMMSWQLLLLQISLLL